MRFRYIGTEEMIYKDRLPAFSDTATSSEPSPTPTPDTSTIEANPELDGQEQ